MINIDTAHIKFHIHIPGHLLIHPWKRRTVEGENGSEKVWYAQKHYINSAKIFMKYYPVDYYGKPLLVIELSSIPKLLFGNNIIPIIDIEKAIEALNEIFSLLLLGLHIDIGDGTLERIDFFNDYFVGEYVENYLEAISRLYYPRRHRCLFTNRSNRKRKLVNGISFWCDDYECVFYDQQLKRGTYGFIRHESRLLDTDVIETATGLFQPTLRGITPRIVFNVLKKDLVRLGLWETSISGGSLALDELMRNFKPNKAHRLLHTLEVIHDHPMMDKTGIAAYLGIGTQQFNRTLYAIIEAGISPGMIDREITLPQLTLLSPEDEEYKIVPKVPSDTAEYNILVTQYEISSLNGVIK